MDELPTYKKQELAEHQLDRAIRLLLDDGDVICAITLGGAAEDILGGLVNEAGGIHSHQEFIDACISEGVRIGEKWTHKDLTPISNYFRNELKHYSEGSDITVSPSCAYELIDRAAENLWRLTGYYSASVQRYLREVRGE